MIGCYFSPKIQFESSGMLICLFHLRRLGSNTYLTRSVQFSIITPSFRNSEWLKLCIPSVADQQVELEHIVQDSVSDDGTLDWLPQDRRVKAFIEKDRGMYDAVNRGLRKAKGEILAYINCDEQYLPGALQSVWDFFQKNPNVEICFADTVVVDAQGEFVCFRKVHLPWEYPTYVCGLCTLTCSTFFRRSVIDKHALFFNDDYRELGDADWIVGALQKRILMKVFRHYTSIFTETGNNLGLLPNSVRERKIFADRAPQWVRKSELILKKVHHVRRFFQGGYHQKPFSYAIFTRTNPGQRTAFQVAKPTPFWNRSFVTPTPAGTQYQAQT
jgi:glycosyltransferase involved in cell wall biosynthesis